MTIGEAVGSYEVIPQHSASEVYELQKEFNHRIDLEGKAIQRFSPYYPVSMLRDSVKDADLEQLEFITGENFGDVGKNFPYAFPRRDVALNVAGVAITDQVAKIKNLIWEGEVTTPRSEVVVTNLPTDVQLRLLGYLVGGK